MFSALKITADTSVVSRRNVSWWFKKPGCLEKLLGDLGPNNPNELGIRLRQTAETRFSLVLAMLQYHLQCLIAHNMDAVYTKHMLLDTFSSICVSKENKLDYDINYNPFPT